MEGRKEGRRLRLVGEEDSSGDEKGGSAGCFDREVGERKKSRRRKTQIGFAFSLEEVNRYDFNL